MGLELAPHGESQREGIVTPTLVPRLALPAHGAKL